MPIPRAVISYHPAFGSTRGRPISPEHQSRIDAAISPGRVEFIMEPDPEKRMKALEEAEFYLTKNAPLPAGLFDKAKRLRLIQVATVFGEKVDAEAAARAGVAVSFCGRPIVDSVADHSLALLLNLVRTMPESARSLREGSNKPLSPTRPDGSAYNWTQIEGVRPLRGMRLGLLGMSEISRAVSIRAKAFGMEVRYWNRSPLPEWIDRKTGASPVTQDELFRTSDVIFPGLMLNEDTRHIVGEEALRAMPAGSYIINISRGPLVDLSALLRALEDGHIAGAGLDVFDPEPFPTDHPLLDHPGVFLTPHLAGGDNENLVRELESWMANVHRVIDGEEPIDIVNGVAWRAD
ncbi:MAG: NAD(P)-dependent oxidoreductase [Nitrospinota bacterium]